MILDSRKKSYLFIIFVSWFIFLSLLHYFSKRPLWLDEIGVLNNIKESSVRGLFADLKYGQIFPRMYLAAIKIFSEPFNYNVLSLRFFPLAFMSLAFFIWLKIYSIEVKDNLQLSLILGLLSSAGFMSYYAAELKQYSADLFAVALFTLFIYHQKRFLEKGGPVKWLVLFSIISPFLIPLSYASIFMFWIIIYNYLFFLRRDKRIWPAFIVYLVLVLLNIYLLYRIDLRYSMVRKSLVSCWGDYFIATDSIGNFFKTLTEGMRNLTVRWFLEKKFAREMASVFLPFCWLAVFKYSKASMSNFKGMILDINSITGILILELFISGVFRIYPFTGERMTLFIAPFIFYMIIKGIYLVKDIKVIFYPLLAVYFLFIPLVSGYSLSRYSRIYLDNFNAKRYVKEIKVKETSREEAVTVKRIIYQSTDAIDFNTLSKPGRILGKPKYRDLEMRF